jgi:Mrp family chromosome partitioning ATPase
MRRRRRMTQTINNSQNGNINGKADISAIEAEEIKLNDLTPEQQLELEKLKLDPDMASDADKEAEEINRKTEEVTKTPPRRLVIVDGGKGGVGKSMWTRGFLQTCIDEKRRIVAVDADNSNPDLLRYYGENGEHCQIQQLNIFKDGSIDRFFDQVKRMMEPEPDTYNQLAPPESLFLLELPPQSRQIFKKFIEQEFLETAANDYDIRVTMVVVISRVSDSVKQLIDLYSFCGNKVDYIVVRNLFYGEESEFSRYSNSSIVQEIKQELLKAGIPLFDITMPDLLEYAYDYLDEKSQSFSEGIKQKELPGVKMRVKSWLKNFKQQICPVKHVLGLESINVEIF